MHSLRVLHPADYRVMPWKNGLGTTTEIAVDPAGAGLDDFTWRLSIADIRASGPFSTFVGYDRILVQLEGAPMTLVHDGLEEHRLQLLSPYGFAGDLTTYGALEAPPARDFNVMIRRERGSAALSVHAIALGATVRTEGEAATRIVYVLRGSAAVRVGAETRAIVRGETIVAGEVAVLLVTATSDDTVAFCVTLGPPGR